MNEYLVPFMYDLHGFYGIISRIYFWNPFFFSLFIASTNLFSQLVDVFELVMEG